MNVFLDNQRTPPDGFVHVTNAQDCKNLLLNHEVEILCLDHGLGRGNPNGFDLVQWMVENNIQVRQIYLHSGNYPQKRAMFRALQIYVLGHQVDTELHDFPYPY